MSILRSFSQSGPPSKRRREMLGDESDDSSDSDNISPSGVSDTSQKVVSAAEVQNQTLLSSLPNSIQIG